MNSTLWIKFKDKQTLKNVLVNDFNYFLNKFFISDYGFKTNDCSRNEIFFDERSLWITSNSIDNNIDYISFLAKKFNTTILSFSEGNFYFFNIMGNKICINSIKNFQNLFCIIFDYLNKKIKDEEFLQKNLSLRYHDIYFNFRDQLSSYISILNNFFDGDNSLSNKIELISYDLFNLSNGLFLKTNYSRANHFEAQKKENIKKAELLDSKIIDGDFFKESNNNLYNNQKDEPFFLNNDLNLDSCKKQFDIKEESSKPNFNFFPPTDNKEKSNLLKENDFFNSDKSNLISIDLLANYPDLNSLNESDLNSLQKDKLFLFSKYQQNDSKIHSENIASIIAQNISIESYKIHELLMESLWTDSYKYNFYFFSKNKFNNLDINLKVIEKTDNPFNNLTNDNKFDEEIIDKYEFNEILCPCSDDNNILDNKLNILEEDALLNSINSMYASDLNSSLKEYIEEDIDDFNSINFTNKINDKEWFNESNFAFDSDKIDKSKSFDSFLLEEDKNNVTKIDNFFKDPLNQKDVDVEELINREFIDKNPDTLILEVEKKENDLFNLNKEGNNMSTNNKYESLSFTSDEIYKNKNDNFDYKDNQLNDDKYTSFGFTNDFKPKEIQKQSIPLFNTSLNSKIYSSSMTNDGLSMVAKKDNTKVKATFFNFDNVPEVYDEKININVNFKNLANDFIKKENQNFIDFIELNKKDEEERLNLSMEIEKFLNELKEEKRKIQLKKQELQNKLHR